MPTSRTRRTRNRSNADRKRNRASKVRAQRTSAAASSELDAIHGLFTNADWQRIRRSEHAAAEGDLDKALELYDGIPQLAGSQLSRGMRQLRELGDDAPAWMWSRWVCEQAFRWVSPENEVRHEAALNLALEVAYAVGVDPDRPFGLAPRDFVALVRSRDWIVRQVVLYELGGLADFVVNVAGPDLLARAENLIGWEVSPMSTFQQIDETPTCVRLLDLVTEEEVDVLNIGSTLDVAPGGFLLGRLVPISVEPGHVFESVPLAVDEETARTFAERCQRHEARMSQWDWDCRCDVDACDSLSCRPNSEDRPRWWDDLRDACDDARVPPLFSVHFEYSLCTDIPTEVLRHVLESTSNAQLFDELVAADVPKPVAEAIQICAYGVLGAPLHGERLTACAPILGAAVLEPGSIDILMNRLTLPQYAHGWHALAQLVVEPAKSRCLALADASARFGSRAAEEAL